jgi:hypothetical protein
MSAGSGASNFGYGNINPYNTSSYVNGTSSNYSGSFSSNEIPGTPPGPLPGLAGAKSNIDAAAGIDPGICLFKGGAKKLKRKIKNITKQYKRMKAGSRKMRSLKRKLRSRAASRRMAGGRRSRSRSRKQRGGYSQYQNNQPFSMSYSVGGINLPSSQSALANPPPIQSMNNAIDNLNAYTMRGFPSKGH